MNPVVRHFLPSVVRGVYRADDEFAKIMDEQAFARFVKAKLCFLPPTIAAKFRNQLSFDDNFERAQRQLTLPGDQIESVRTTTQRSNTFFHRHPYFQNALGAQTEIEGADNFLEVHFVRKVLAPLLNDEGMGVVRPQHQVGPYYLDFALAGASKFALEVDGFGKFKERSDLDNFIKRQNYITSQGWRVIRFTYAQIMENNGPTLKLLHSLLKSDAQLRSLLAGQQQIGFLWEPGADTSKPNVLEVVNDFYRVQDHFAETVLATDHGSRPFRVRDNFDLGVPFVALAISSLYKFLEAVQSVVDVDFELPAVEFSGVRCSAEWASELHHLIKPADVAVQGGTEWNALAVQLRPATLPAPALGAGKVRFRENLTLQAIRQGLQYFCSDVFGYKETQPFQDLVLQRVFNGQHVLGISATGSGKSFCFWLPALLRPGLTLIICPLRSLMRDQHLTLRNYGIACTEFINADVDKLNQRRIMEEARLGYVRLLYVSPERLRIKKFLAELAQLQQAVPIHFLAVDEAHCISEWGHDFRPSYLKLPFLREKLSKENEGLQLIALTATAGQQVERDMLGILKLRDGENGPVIRDRGADRPKFSYQIVDVQAGKTKKQAYQEILSRHLPTALRQRSLPDLLRQVNQRTEKAVGIVFCIYADPHGKHSIHDGIAHYLFETMAVIEPGKRFEGRGPVKMYREDAFSTGQVRAFSSKTPTLCPNPRCHSYEYTSIAFNRANDDDDDEDVGSDNEIDGDEESVAPAQTGGRKVCANCGLEFDGIDHFKPAKWERLIKANQTDFKESNFDVLVATKGFGMGIDKSSVRFVVHTSLSSGLESWYQEVGRAGRDYERAHIVLLVDPPNEACRRELGALEIKRPRCSYRGGCPHGKEALCDYGKQHMFITSSYPGAESDAVSALRVLDKLIVAREGSSDGSVVLSASNKYLSHTELAVYRLTVLGLVDDYVVTHQPNPRFDVTFLLPESPDRPNALARIQQKMQEHLAEHLSHFSGKRGRTIERELEKRIQEYQPLGNFAAKTRSFATIERYEKLFNSVYQHLLLQLDHTYKDVVQMRYDMLWNLLAVVDSKDKQRCRREPLLQHFVADEEKARYEGYRCGLCDVCVETLNFTREITNQPNEPPGNIRSESELTNLLNEDQFNHGRLTILVHEFRDYPASKYRQARQVLEGSANNLPALFLAREFSPSEEYVGNAKRLLHTANQKPLPLSEVVELFKSSKALKTELLLTLNEADTTCDVTAGWRFLAEEAAKPEHQLNDKILEMRECLDFMLLVEEGLSDETEPLKHKARELEEAFYA